MGIANKFLFFLVAFNILMMPQNLSSNVKIEPAPSAVSESLIIEEPSDFFEFPEKGVPVLMYHSISTNPNNSLCVSEKQFTEEMEWLHSQSFKTITVEQLYQALNGKAKLPDKPVLITFDDGYKDNYQTAWPILKRYGFAGTFFIIANSVSPKSIDWDQLKDLVKQGNSIGSHTVHHLDLPSLSASNLESELGDSKRIFEEKLGIKISSFCYPAGKYNQNTIDMLLKTGYDLAFTTASGLVHNGDNQFKLKRLRISGGMTISSFKYLLT